MNVSAQRKLAGLALSMSWLMVACNDSVVDGTGDPAKPGASSPGTPGSTPTKADPTSSGSATLPPQLRRVWKAEVSAVSTPVTIGQRVVVYAKTRAGLSLVGLDSQTGQQRWRVPATVAATQADAVPSIATTSPGNDQLIAGLVPSARSDRWQVVTLSPQNGQVTAKSRPLWITSWPVACDNSPEICFSGWTEAGATATFAMKPRSGVVRTLADASGTPPTPATVDGWRFTPTENNDLMWATRIPERKPQAGGWRAQWRDGVIAGVSTSTGKSLWQQAGVAPGCAPSLPLGTVCTGPGTARSKSGKIKISGHPLALTRVDLASGKHLWSVPLTASALSNGVLRSGVASDNATLVDLGAGAQLLDLETGALSAPDSAARFACAQQPTFKVGAQQRPAVTTWRTCTSTLRWTKKQDFATTAHTIGTATNELHVVVGAEQLFGYQ